LLQAAHVAEHTFHVLEHVARAHAQQFAFAPLRRRFVGPLVQRVDPLLHRAALVLADVLQQVQGVARIQQHLPVT
jgi:predicted HicB family RNase H-like nuclease